MAQRADLGRNGTYLVLRDLSQDVSGFWRFLDQQSATGHSAQDLADAMVGRMIDGARRAAQPGHRLRRRR